MRYMLLIYNEETLADEAGTEAPEISPPWREYTDWLLRERIHVAGERLAGSSTATTVRVRDGKNLVTDGPYSETKEVLGGYYIVDCPDIDKALQAAERCPAALTGSIEVRPIIGMPINPPTTALAAE